MNRLKNTVVALIALIVLSSVMPSRLNAGGEEIDPGTEPSGLIEYLWWNIFLPTENFILNFDFPPIKDA